MEILDYSESFEEKHEELHEDFFTPLLALIQTGFFADVKEKCKYCGTPMEIPMNEIENGGGGSSWVNRVYSCSRCGWWYELDQDEIYIGEGDYFATTRYKFGTLREYDVESISVPIMVLRRALLKNINLLFSIHPTKMEQLVGSVFRDYFSCDVMHLGKSKDGGIDLLLIDGDKQYVVQVKRRSTSRSVEGVDVVRELVGAMVLTQQRSGIFVTTADHFTRPAMNAVKTARKLGVVKKIELIDIHRFIDVLNLTADKVEMPWEKHRRLAKPNRG